MDANKTYGEKPWRQLHKNAACNIEQVLEATPHKTVTVRPPTIHHENYQIKRTRNAGHCWRSKDQLISDILLYTPSHGRAKAGRPAKPYIQQLCTDTGRSLEDQPEAMDDIEGWRERVREICAGKCDMMMMLMTFSYNRTHSSISDIYIYIYIYIYCLFLWSSSSSLFQFNSCFTEIALHGINIFLESFW